MDDPQFYAHYGQWGLPLFIALQLFREWLHWRERQRAKADSQAQIRVISKVHDLLPSHILSEGEVWDYAPQIEEAKKELARSLPPEAKK